MVERETLIAVLRWAGTYSDDVAANYIKEEVPDALFLAWLLDKYQKWTDQNQGGGSETP